MKRITLLLFMSLLSFCGYAQLAPECFEGTWAPVAASPTSDEADWLTLDNGIGLNFSWVQQDHSGSTPSYEGVAGTHAAFIDDEQVPGAGTNPAEDLLVTPQFTMPVGGELRFQSRLTQAGNQGSIYRVYILVGDDADPSVLSNYTMIEEWTETELALSPILVYEEKVLAFGTTYDGETVRLAFSMIGDAADRWLIDCVSVTQPCLEVENLVAEDMGLGSAQLDWDNPGGATSWEIEIVLEGDVPTGNGIIYNGDLPYDATSTASGDPLVQTPFLPNTGYKFYVKALCDDGGSSDWVGAHFFQTVGLGDTCVDPLVIAALPFSDTDNTASFADEYNGFPGTGCGNMSWEDYLSGNDVVYSFTADFTGVISVELTNNDAYSGIFIYDECSDIGVSCDGGGVGGWQGNDVIIPAFNVVEGEDYYFVVSTYANQTTNYTLTIQQVFCDEPVGLETTNIGMTSATLNWTNPTGATSWEIVIQDPGDGIPAGSGTTVSTNPTFAASAESDGSAFTSATPYEYYVRAACGDGNFSAWAGPYQFNTMVCEADEQCDFTFTMWDSFGDGWNGNTMTVSQNGIAIEIITLASGAGPQEVTVPMCDGLPIQLFWNAGGSWANEVGVSIQNGFDQVVYTKNPGSGSQNSLLYDGTVDCDDPECLPPTGLTVSNIGMDTVDLSWDGADTGNWEYYIVEEGEPAPTDATDGTPTTTNPTVGAGGPGVLDPSTNYEYYVRMICDNPENPQSSWSEPFEFATAACDFDDQCEYTFVMNSNWWAGWQGGTMTISQNDAPVAIIGSSFTTGQTQSVSVFLCDDIPFEVEWTSGGGWMGQMGLEIINSYDQTLFTLPFNSTTGVGTVIFEAENDCDFPACIAPTGLYTQNGTMDSIEIGWDGPATGDWEYYIVEAGEPAPSDTTPGIATEDNPTVAALPNPGTNYEFYVRLVCEGAASDFSPWAGPVAFHSELCNDEDKCNFTFEMLSNNGWGGEQNTFTIYQGGVPVAQFPNADNIWWWGTSYTEEIALCHNEEIEVVWNAGMGWTPNDKGLVIYSPFLEDIYTMDFGDNMQGDTVFTGVVSCDPPPCPKPQNLNVTDVGFTQATLEWEEMGDATEWAVWVLEMGEEDPLPDSTPTFISDVNPVIFGDDAGETLMSGTPYQFFVMAMCGDEDGNSTVSGPFVFVTALENDECEGAVDVPVNPAIECVDVVNGTMTGATSSGIQASCMWMMPVADVWYSFEATSENHAISLANITGNVWPYIAVYEGDCDGGLTEVLCTSMQTVTLNELTVGNTYYVQLYATWVSDPSALTSFELCIRTPEPPITVSDSLYTVEELVQDVLLGSDCALISNITSSTGTDFGSSSGLGYFNYNESSFPFEDGIIMATGDIQEAPAGSNFFGFDSYAWVGDDDLLQILNDGGFFGTTHNATVLEFDFVPLTDNISFNFMMASDEYGIFQCNFSDAFAFILTGPDIDDENLAVIPGTNIPVSVTTIRDSQYNTGCGDANIEYFDQYNANDPIAANISYNGQTVVMQASADVVPGETYHIKMVIADWNDTGVNSAVFLEGGSFDVGSVDLGLDLTQENNNAVCNGAEAVLETNLEAEDYDFVWYVDGEVIDGEDSPTLLVNQDNYPEGGFFEVRAYYPGTDCFKLGDVDVEFFVDPAVIVEDPLPISVCGAGGFAEFDLEQNTPIMIEGGDIDPSDYADYTVTYHLTAEDAENNVNPLESPFTNTVAGGQEIHVRIQHVAGCHGVHSFPITVNESQAIITMPETVAICEGSAANITADVTNAADDITYAWTHDGIPMPDTGNSIDVVEAGVYELTITEGGCVKSEATTVTVIEVPEVEEFEDVEECESYTLPVLAVGNYYTAAGGTGTMLAEGSVIDTNQEIFIYAANTAGETTCSDESSFMVTIFSPAFNLGGPYVFCDATDATVSVSPENFNTGDATYEWTINGVASAETGSSIDATEFGMYAVTVTVNGCSTTGSVEVAASAIEVMAEVTDECIDNIYTLEVSDIDGSFEPATASYAWTGPNGFTADTQSAVPVGLGTYTVTVTTADGCVGTASLEVVATQCFIQRGISPDGDGDNDFFDLTTLDVDQLSIFNRYGQEVYSRTDYTNQWVGQTDSGDELPTGTYFYMIERSNGEQITGWIYINREE